MNQPMNADRPPLSIVPPAASVPETEEFDDPLPVELPRPQAELTPAQRKVWLYVGKALRDAGLVHRTDAITLTVIVRTFCNWLDLEQQLEAFKAKNNGDMVKVTDKGYPVVHPLFYAAQTEKKALLQWLPEAALTIPSYQKAIAALNPDRQGSLFEDDALGQYVRNKPQAV